MKSELLPSSLALNGPDKFILALEQHPRPQGAAGNTCHYLMELEGTIDAEAFRAHLQQDPWISYLSSLQLAKKAGNRRRWIPTATQEPVVRILEDDTFLPLEIRSLHLELEGPLLCFHLIRRSKGHFALVLSWHHLLMDGYGATLLLRHLSGEKCTLFEERVKTPVNRSHFRAARKAKRFIDKSSQGNLAAIDHLGPRHIQAVIDLVELNKEEGEKMRQCAEAAKARFGTGNFVLATAATMVNKHVPLINAGADFWVPIPQDKRKKGAIGPIIGNQLSFLFYRIKSKPSSDAAELVADLDQQMLQQIKEHIPSSYGHLMNYMRRAGSKWYYRRLKGPHGASLTSFLLTHAPEHPKSLDRLFGIPIVNAVNIPPNSPSPGLTISVSTFGDRKYLILQTYAHILSEEQAAAFLADFKNTLIHAK